MHQAYVKKDRTKSGLNINEKACLYRLACFRDDSTAIQPPLRHDELVLFQELGGMRVNWDRESSDTLSEITWLQVAGSHAAEDLLQQY